MTRGIHLKRLKSADLEMLGLPDELLPGADLAEASGSQTLLAQADPVLFQVFGELRRGLEGTLQLLDQALPTSGAAEQDGTEEPQGEGA